MTYIEIKSCTDPMRWYAKYIGDKFLLLDEEEVEYKTREPGGYINFILKKDGQLVDL
jgi:hypothetical protein